MPESIDHNPRKQRAKICLREVHREVFYDQKPVGDANSMRLESLEDNASVDGRCEYKGHYDKPAGADVDPSCGLQAGRGPANNNISPRKGSVEINSTTGPEQQGFAHSKNVPVRSQIETGLLDEICRSRYTVDPLPGLFARHKRKSATLEAMRCDAGPIPYELPSDEGASVEGPFANGSYQDVPVAAELDITKASCVNMPVTEAHPAQGTIEAAPSSTSLCGAQTSHDDITTSPFITKINGSFRRWGSIESEDGDKENKLQPLHPHRKRRGKKKRPPPPRCELEDPPWMGTKGAGTVMGFEHRKRLTGITPGGQDVVRTAPLEDPLEARSHVYENIRPRSVPGDGYESTDGCYSSCGEENLEGVMRRINTYNRGMGAFHMEATPGDCKAEFQGVLRFYHLDGPHAVSKALKLKNTTTVSQLRPLLAEKFNLSRHLETCNETTHTITLLQKRFDGELLLEDADRPLELALTSRCRSRFVVRVSGTDPEVACPDMHPPASGDDDADTRAAGDVHVSRRSKRAHHRRRSKRHGTDGAVSDCGCGGDSELTVGGGHRCYESDTGVDNVMNITTRRGVEDAESRASSRRGRRRREKREGQQHVSKRESSLERISSQLSLRKGSLRLTRSMTNLVQKTFSLRQRENPFPPRPELSTEESAPGVLKIFGGSISPGAEYKSVLSTPSSTGRELVKEALERYQISRRHARHYVLCDVIGRFIKAETPLPVESDRHRRSAARRALRKTEVVWVEECVRVIGDHERPLTMQAFWKPSEECSRRFELRKRADLVANVDTVTSGINANARRMLVTKARLRPLPGTDTWPRNQGDDGSIMANDEVNSVSRDDSQDNINQVPGPGDQHHSRENSLVTALPSHPYLVLLRGYDARCDRMVYVMRERVTMVGGGQRPHKASHVDICLQAPDILPEHCWLSRSMAADGSEAECAALDPMPDAAVSVNGRRAESTLTLRGGDVVEIGDHYAFLYKPPPRADQSVDLTHIHHTLEARHTAETGADRGVDPERPGAEMLKWRRTRSDQFEVEPGRMRLGYVREKEDELLDRILSIMEKYPQAPNLTTAYLTCMCVEHSLAKFGASATRDLLSKLSSLIQVTVWEATKLLADKQGIGTGDRTTHIRDLLPDLQPVILWLCNAVELHRFFRKSVRDALRKSEIIEKQDGDEGPPEDEMVVILEDVVKYTFQQTVYYLTKALYPHLPAILERNPFSTEDPNISCNERLTEAAPTVEELIAVLDKTLAALKDLGLHPEILSQLFCYLFFFTSTNLFNMLMARDAGTKYYRWSKGAQVRGNLDALEAWAASAGLAQEAITYLSKINTLTNLLATPRLQLLTANWHGLQRDFPRLNNEQLLKVLTEYDLGPGQEQPEAWVPPDGAIDPVTWSSHLTEGFSDHPPLRLPKTGFVVDLCNSSPEHGLCDVLLHLSSEFGVSDDDGDSGLSVSQTLPVFTDIPQSPVYIAGGTDLTDPGPDFSISADTRSPTDAPPPYPPLPGPASCHPAPSAPCYSAPCPIPPKRRSKQERQKPTGSCADTSTGTPPSRGREPDLGDSGISMSADRKEVHSPSTDAPRLVTWSDANNSRDSGETSPPVRTDNKCNASQAHSTASTKRSSTRHVKSTSPNRRTRGESRSPPRYRVQQVKVETLPSPTDYTCTGPLAVSSPVSSDSTPCPSPVDVLSSIPPQPKTPAPTLDRASIRRSPRMSSRKTRPLVGDGEDSNKVVEVPYLHVTTPDGMVNGLRVLPLAGNQSTTVSTKAELTSDSSLKASLLHATDYGVEKESSVDEGPVPQDQEDEEEEQEDVYIVDLVKGERGLGLGLIDGLFTPLRRPGIYVRTLVPGEPAERDGRLQIGDRILAVNGQSVVGSDYRSAMNTIRDGGQFLQFLVAQGTRIITMQITASSC